MNDKELIEELRDFHTLCGDTHCDHGEATESEHCAACQAEFPCSAIRAADALEARKPSEDDREALDKIVTEYDMALYTKEETLDRLSRAAVPDAANRELTEAIRLTVEYVGNDMLPAIEGWDWYDALVKYAPEVAQAFVDKPIHFPKSAERDAALAECRTLRGERNTFEDDLAKEIHRADAALAAVERVTAERDSAMARIAKAWELHEPFTWSFGYGPVQSCKWCAENGVPQEVASWPCATIRALEEGGIDDGFQED